MGFHRWLSMHLVTQLPDGTLAPPGAGRMKLLRDGDDAKVTAVAQGDRFDLYVGKREIFNFAVSPRVLVRLAVWVLWWFVVVDWCGLKTKLWNWNLRRLQDEREPAPRRT